MLERWAEYFEELLSVQSSTDEHNEKNEYQTAEIEMLPPSLEEIS